MPSLLLVEPSPDERARVTAAAPGATCRSATVGELTSALGAGSGGEVDAVVLGAQVEAPIPAVQQVHGAAPLAAVVVLTTAAAEAEVRRAASYAPGMPSSLTVLAATDPAVPAVVAEAVAAGRARRRHEALLAAVAEPEAEPRQPGPGPQRVSMGALIDHAPFGVVVADTQGRLVTWNPWAADLLGLADEGVGESVERAFVDAGPLRGVFELARTGRLGESTPAFDLETLRGAALEVTVVGTELGSGRGALLLLLQDISERRRVEATRARLSAQVGLLARVSEALAGTLDGDAALRRLADLVVPAVGDWASLQTYDTRGNPRLVAVHHGDPSLASLAGLTQASLAGATADTTPSRRVARGEGPVLLPEVTADHLTELVPDPEVRALVDRLGVGSVLAVPLPGRDVVLGSMVLVNAPGSPRFTEDDLALATEVGRRAGVALETVSLYNQQHDLAAELQRSLMTEPPASEHGEIVVRYLAAAHEAQVGGDWYDAFVQADGGTVVVIGDVVGHDTRAAAAMGQLRGMLRGIAYTTGSGPADMLSRLDAAIEGLELETTATALAARIEPADREQPTTRMRWSNAGHPPPVLITADGVPTVLDDGSHDLLLGVITGTVRRERELVMQPGTTLLLYTDGLVERRGRSIDEGVQALLEAVEALDGPGRGLADLCDRLLAALLPEERDDDVALVAIRLRPEGPQDAAG